MARHWLRQETDRPEAEFDYAVGLALAPATRESDLAVVVLGGSPANEALAARVRQALYGA
ncbi:hypothetical protein [Janibacter sp. G1551]|uniref:hypothetical protein n=1 Tax=Janibacter sp. G1551 TaxID=3420440 RepID=UPI003CFDD7B0